VGTGSFDVSGSPPILAGPADTFIVCLYTPGGNSPYTILPNVQCLRIDYKEGANPPVAEFKYLQDDNLQTNLNWPSQFDQLWPIDATGNYVVNPDERLVVLVINPDGSTHVIFDGFAQIPQVALASAAQQVTFAAVGVAVRCFDDVVLGRTQRDSDPIGITITDGSADVGTDLPTRFNPADTAVADGNKGGYLPNCTADGNETIGPDGFNYPVFLDPGIETTPDPREYWSVPRAIKYLLGIFNGAETYVKNPTFDQLGALLQNYTPTSPGGTMNPDDDSTFTAEDVTVRDYDVGNKPWPNSVENLLSYCGFVMRFDTDQDSNGLPITVLKFYRRDEFTSSMAKAVYLATGGSSLDPAANNVVGLHLARDCNSIVNAWLVETSQQQVEVSVVLAPLWQPTAVDDTSANRKQFFKSSWTPATTAATRRKYRWYGADELGAGHWTGAAWEMTPCDFSTVFPNNDDGTFTFVNRYRPGSHAIISLDSNGAPLHSVLQILFSTADLTYNSTPGIFTPDSGLPLTDAITINGGWKSLDDRLGIEVTLEDPEQWNGGKTLGDIRGVSWWSNPPSGAPVFAYPPVLILTTVIEDDLRMPINVPKRIASPTIFTRRRSADGRDHFQHASVSAGSLYYTQDGGNGTDPYVVRDDTTDATTHAYQLRSAHEFPPLAGSITIPFWTAYYEVGDRVQIVQGRNVTLQTNVGVDQGEAPCYPWVVGVSWNFDGDRQQTKLQLSDHRGEVRNL